MGGGGGESERERFEQLLELLLIFYCSFSFYNFSSIQLRTRCTKAQGVGQ